MSEESLKTPWELAMEPDESLSPEQVAGHKIAALILVANVMFGIAIPTILKSQGIPIILSIIGLVIAWCLYRRIVNAANVVVTLSCLDGVFEPVFAFLARPWAVAVLKTLMIWGLVGAILLLLLGKSSMAQRLAAIAIFLLLTVGIYACVVIQVLSR